MGATTQGSFTNDPGQNAYTSAPLPAAGAYGNGATVACANFNDAEYECTYTRGAAGGAVKVAVETSLDGGTTWVQAHAVQLNETTVPNLPAEVVHDTVPEAVQRKTSGAAAVLFPFKALNVNASHVRIKAAEVGVVGTPGTFGARVRLRRI